MKIDLPDIKVDKCLSTSQYNSDFLYKAPKIFDNKIKLIFTKKYFSLTNKKTLSEERLYTRNVYFLLRVHPSYWIYDEGNRFYIANHCNNTLIDLGQFTKSPYYSTSYTDFGTCPQFCNVNYTFKDVILNRLTQALPSSSLEELIQQLNVVYFSSNPNWGDTCSPRYLSSNFYTIFTPKAGLKDFIRSEAIRLGLS